MSYVSSGRLALIGSMAESSAVAERIGDALETVIVAPPGDDAGDGGRARVIRADITGVDGHLGAFTLRAEADGAPVVVAPSPLTGDKPFDIVSICGANRPDARDSPARLLRPARRRGSARAGARAGGGSSSASSRSPATSATTRTSARTERRAYEGARAASTPAPPAPSVPSGSASRSTRISARERGSARARARAER